MITLPVELRETMDIRQGDYLAFYLGPNDMIGLAKVDLNKRPDLREYTEEGLPEAK